MYRVGIPLAALEFSVAIPCALIPGWTSNMC